MKIYEIKHDKKTVGSAEVTIEGLYYKIVCQCALSKPALYRVYATTEKTSVDLGICVPMASHYTLVKRLPQNQLVGEDIRFYVCEKDVCDSKNRLLIEEGKPFEHIDRLENARIECCENKLYLVISGVADQL